MKNEITINELYIITKHAFKESKLSYSITMLSIVFLIGIFIEPISGITGIVLCSLLQLMNIIIGIQNIQIKILNGKLPKEYLNEMFINK